MRHVGHQLLIFAHGLEHPAGTERPRKVHRLTLPRTIPCHSAILYEHSVISPPTSNLREKIARNPGTHAPSSSPCACTRASIRPGPKARGARARRSPHQQRRQHRHRQAHRRFRHQPSCSPLHACMSAPRAGRARTRAASRRACACAPATGRHVRRAFKLRALHAL